jgi:hypothetical protein
MNNAQIAHALRQYRVQQEEGTELPASEIQMTLGYVLLDVAEKLQLQPDLIKMIVGESMEDAWKELL